ncbi:hypothetical protein GCM10011364_06210 [Mangrovimonas yunxiaonensis]|nr:hypothetical protein GCM10011364_06210 [Mangrovimonas yunxiaonensis]
MNENKSTIAIIEAYPKKACSFLNTSTTSSVFITKKLKTTNKSSNIFGTALTKSSYGNETHKRIKI